jgi:hypothetical protein
MTTEEFDALLCRLKRRQPFQAFIVEYSDGSSIVVKEPHLAINNGATYWSLDDGLFDIAPEQVRAIRLATGEAVA